MRKTLTFKTTSMSDYFQIMEENNTLFKVYKTSWLGSHMNLNLDHKKYRITRNNIWLPQIIITDNDTHLEIAKTKVKIPFFGFNPKATTIFNTGESFDWHPNGFFNYKWNWLHNNKIIIKSEEENKLFSINGNIELLAESNYNPLLIALGIYLRASILNHFKLRLTVGIIFSLLFLFRWIYS